MHVIIQGIRAYQLAKDREGLYLYALTADHIDSDYNEFVVPMGFVTNGATIPRWLRKRIYPTGELFRAAVVHDYLYWSHDLVTRRQADKIFRRILCNDTDPILRRILLPWPAWLALRITGKKYWPSKRNFAEQPYLDEDNYPW